MGIDRRFVEYESMGVLVWTPIPFLFLSSSILLIRTRKLRIPFFVSRRSSSSLHIMLQPKQLPSLQQHRGEQQPGVQKPLIWLKLYPIGVSNPSAFPILSRSAPLSTINTQYWGSSYRELVDISPTSSHVGQEANLTRQRDSRVWLRQPRSLSWLH